MKIDGYTRLAAVVAKPIKHSLSPFIHNRAFDLTAVNGAYLAWEIESDDLEQTLANIRRYDMFGINLSMPYKQAVIPYLDGLSPAAELIGAVNTVVKVGDQLIGHNTDGLGFFRSLSDFQIQGQTMTILGSGGAATAIICQAALDAAGRIIVFDKSKYLSATQERMANLSRQTGVSIDVYDLGDEASLAREIGASDLLVQATSMGMDGSSLPVPWDLVLKPELLVADVIYQPLETPFLAWAKEQGCQTVNGLGMLLHQAAAAFELWTGQAMPTEVIGQDLADKFR